jgi:hypothetical protein
LIFVVTLAAAAAVAAFGPSQIGAPRRRRRPGNKEHGGLKDTFAFFALRVCDFGIIGV